VFCLEVRVGHLIRQELIYRTFSQRRNVPVLVDFDFLVASEVFQDAMNYRERHSPFTAVAPNMISIER